jgi:hypothetical protein
MALDGVFNETVWGEATPVAIPAGNCSYGTGCGATDLTAAAAFKTVWNANGLWIGVTVSDPGTLYADNAAPWNGSGVEIFLDLNNTRGGYNAGTGDYNDANTYQWTITYNSAAIVEYHNATARTILASSKVTAGTGYAMEIEIPWANLGVSAPAAGAISGLNVVVDVADAAGTMRDHAIVAYNGAFNPFEQTPAQWGGVQYDACNSYTATNTPVYSATDTPSASATPTRSQTPSATVTPSPVLSATATPAQPSVWRVNSGGPAYTDTLGNVWAADTNFSGGNTAGTGNAISNTPDPALYQNERWGSYNYTFPVPAGSYQVTLKFAETTWTAAGKRVFNVSINGATVLTNFDIFADAGGEFIADDKVFNNISPSGGNITITLGPASVDNATVDAVQIIPQPAPTSTPTISPTFTRTPSLTVTPTFSPSPAGVPTCLPPPAVGANTPFITWEAEAGTLGGGASVVALTTPTTELSSPQLEASGHAYVALNALGQSVQWTNTTCFGITAVNIRACVPDSPGGGGINTTLDLYVDGAFRQAIPLSSTQTWVYETTSNYNGMSQVPSAGTPHVFWDEARAFITGAAVAPGHTIMLKVDAANTASFYYIDCMDVEAPPPALTQPANTLSIVSYGAQPNNIGFDNAGPINNALSAGQSQGKPVWIPSGTWYCSGGVLNATDVLVEGAGPWYSSVVDVSTSWSNGFFFLAHGASFQNMTIDATQPNAFPGLYAILAYSGTVNQGWTLDNVWARHTMLTWGTGVGILIQNCRVNNSFGDGMNINNTNGTACGNVTVTNNFARGNGDDGITLNSSNATAPLMYNCTYTHNTSVASWWADNMGIYGGTGVTVEYNLLQDSVKLNGLLVGIFGNGGTGGVMQQALVMNNTLVRCGSLGYGNKNPGIAIGGAQGGSAPEACENIVVSGNTINNPMWDGIDFFNGVSQTAQYNTINAPGRNGIGEGNTGGINTVINNTVTGLTSGVALLNNDGSNVIIQGTPAAAYTASNSVVPEACAEGGQDVGTIVSGSYTAYSGVNLGGLTSFQARVASAGSGGTIQIHLDTPTGTLIGTCTAPVTGGWQTWTTMGCPISATAGTHTVYLVFNGGGGNLFNIEWFSFR